MSEEGKRAAAELVAQMDELRQQRDELASALRLVTTSHAWARLEDDSRHVIRLALDRADRNP